MVAQQNILTGLIDKAGHTVWLMRHFDAIAKGVPMLLNDDVIKSLREVEYAPASIFKGQKPGFECFFVWPLEGAFATPVFFISASRR